MEKKSFERNDYLESLLRLRAEKPHVFKTLSPALRISVGHYAELKSKSEARKGDRAA